jgi:outer membrane protein OmpA-like peptidoglycan-associated protein
MRFYLLVLLLQFGALLFGQGNTITSLVIDDEQNIYLGSATGLSKMEAESRQITRILDRVRVSALASSKHHGVFAACNGNEIWTSSGRKLLAIEGDDTEIHCMMISGGKLWAGTNHGVYVISLSREEISDHFTPANSSLPNDRVNAMYSDGSGIKWIGTDRGVVRIEGDKKWRIYEQNSRFIALAGNIEGTWVAGDREMWLVDSYNRWTPTAVKNGLSQGKIRSVATDRRGRIYILSDIFVQFNPYTDEIVLIEDQSPAMVAQNVALAIDRDDQLWVATHSEGLRMIDPEVDLAERPLIGTLVIKHPTCAGMQDGSIEVRAQGGRQPYQFVWNDINHIAATTKNLGPGKYDILVIDAVGNEYDDVAFLQEPATLVASVVEDGSAEGVALVVNASGGRGDFRYQWSSGQSGRKLAIETAGTYAVTVSDANGCSVNSTYTVDPSIFAETIAEESVELIEPEDEAFESVTVEVLKELDAKKLIIGQVLRIEQLQFQADSTVVREESFEILDGITLFLTQNENIMIEIGGHTNGVPDHLYCDKLSTARAKSVAEYIHDKGISPERITYRGYGKRQPIATNNSVEGRRKNQRVEVKILQL